jgi:hypothetical protein
MHHCSIESAVGGPEAQQHQVPSAHPGTGCFSALQGLVHEGGFAVWYCTIIALHAKAQESYL